ncbi:MAG: NAD-dependent epimerase/dehydratase family protein [Planctomycetota bacterium]
MNVLLIGATGQLGPHVARALAKEHHLRITDINPAPDALRAELKDHEFFELDVTDFKAVRRAAEGTEAIINLSVVRRDRTLAFSVNTLGCYHVMQAAAELGIRRVINTGPHFTVAGPTYEELDFAIGPDVPPHPGTGLYPISKSLGHEICRLYAEAHDIYVQMYLFYNFVDQSEIEFGRGRVPFVVTWDDAAEVFRRGLAIDLGHLPSRCEVFFILADVPQQKFLNDKAKRILNFHPKHDLTALWRRERPA